MIDLRSDTCSKPTDDMRSAMASALVGDDVYGDDPTVNELESETATLLGKENAVFVPTGTMANQIAMRIHTQHGEAAIVDAASHIGDWESGGPAALSGLTLLRVPTQAGVMTPPQILDKIYRPHRFSPQRMHPEATLLCLENTHNSAGGIVWPLHDLNEAAAVGRKAGLKLHLDGARIWNAAAASHNSPAEIVEAFDTVSVCFSKGLGAPMGSILAGPADLVEQARKVKHLFGAGLRQAGIMAAGALYGLRHHRNRLSEDHDNARIFGQAIARLEGCEINLDLIQTNIVRFHFKKADAYRVSEQCREAGLYILAGSPNAMRAVFHLNVTQADTERAATIIGGILERGRS